MYILVARTGQLVGKRTGHTSAVTSLAVHGDIMVTASTDHTAVVWRNETIAATFKAHTRWINGVAISSDGTMAATVSDAHTVRVWSIPAVTLLNIFTTKKRPHDVAFSPTAKEIVVTAGNRGFLFPLSR